MTVLRSLLGIAVLMVASHDAVAVSQLQVRDLTGRTPRDLALFITGCGITVYDVRHVGTTGSVGTFTTTLPGTIGFTDGLMLSTGSIVNVVGPNTADNRETINGMPGDDDLQALTTDTTHDATVLEFDFIPSSTVVTFDYVFASEEYNEWANKSFNDVFGFFMNGQNIALVPGTSTPVSIDTVNGGNPFGTSPQNSKYYLCNANDSCSLAVGSGWSATRFNELEMDGLTVVFTVTATVNPGVINRIKFAIADAGDSKFDSAVFIREGSFGSKCLPSVPPVPPPLASAASRPRAAPNPFRPGSATGITFRDLPAGATVRLYTLAGEPVTVLTDTDNDGVIVWDVKNPRGRDLASGVYLYVVTPRSGRVTRGKVVIIR